MSVLSQLWLLIGKNFTLRKRQPVTLFVEFVWPIMLLLIVAFIKRASPPTVRGPCYYQPLELPNGDFLSFMKSFVCMLDYKCHGSSRIKNSVPIKNHLNPLYDIVTSGDKSYQQVSVLLENLKNALNDVNEIRNEPIVMKIQNGSISLTDFLDNTTRFKQNLNQYGLNNQVSDALLQSQIKIIEIYKVLDVSSKFKEKNLCNPLETYPYLKADPYFYDSTSTSPRLSNSMSDSFRQLINQTFYTTDTTLTDNQKLDYIVSTLSKEQKANFNMADIVCTIPKRQIITDADFLSKQMKFSAVTNYTNTIVDYFSSKEFERTLEYLAKYFIAGQTFGNDFILLQKFSDPEELITTLKSGFKLLKLTQKYDPQFKFLRELTDEFSPLFETIKEYNDLKLIVDFVIALNDLLGQLNNFFTMQDIYGTVLVDFYETNLASDTYSQRYELLQTKVNFIKSIEMIFKLKFDEPRDAICTDPKITGIFNSDLPAFIQSNLDYKLERYCTSLNTVIPTDLADKITTEMNFAKIIQAMRVGISPKTMKNFYDLSQQLSTISFATFDMGSADDILLAFKTTSASLLFIEESLQDLSKINLKTFYTLAKDLIKIYIPDLFTDTQWLYADIFLPILLPTIDLNTGQPVSAARSLMDVIGVNDVDETEDLVSINETVAANETLLLNETVKMVIKRSVMTSTKLPVDLTTKVAKLIERLKKGNGTVEARADFAEQYPNLDSLFGAGSGLSSGLNLGSLLGSLTGSNANPVTKEPILNSLLGTGIGSASNSGTGGLNPLSLFDLIQSFSSGNVLTSTTGLISVLTPLLTLLPLDTIFPENSQETNLALIASLPKFLEFVEFFNSFQLLSLENLDPIVQLNQWKKFIAELKVQAMNLIQILADIGVVKNFDYKIVQAILNTDLETISSPDVIGKVVLGCQAINVWGVITPEQMELKNAMSSMSLLLDLANLGMEATLRLTEEGENKFKCTSNPLDDYYQLTKNLNILQFADRMKKLILNKQTPESMEKPPRLDCIKISTIYDEALRIEKAFTKDVDGIIQSKLQCFRTSLFVPYQSVFESFRNVFTSVESNVDTITILTTQMNKFVDLIKLFSWTNNFFESSGSGENGLLSSQENISKLLASLPTLLADVTVLGENLRGLEKIQQSLNVNDLNRLQSGQNMFELLDTLKSYNSIITEANKAINTFWTKHFDIISKSSYSTILYDIYKGIGALYGLIQFVTDNINGVKINNIFANYDPVITGYLQTTYSITKEDAVKIGDSYVFSNPQQLYDIYVNSKNVYCDPTQLETYVKEDNSAYIQITDNGIDNFWPLTSAFFCGLNTQTLSQLSNSFAESFSLPVSVKEIFEDENSIFQNLNANSSVFTNLNVSTIEVVDAGVMSKLDDMFKIFAGITSEYSGYSLPNILGKSLCGPDFFLDLARFGYTLEMPKTILALNESNKTMARGIKNERMGTQMKEGPNCPALFNEIRKVGGSVIGNLITPLIFGKIIYTPRNNATYKLMQKFNQTFEQFDQLNQVLTSFSNGIDQFDDLKRLTRNLSVLLENPFYKDFIQLFLLQDSNLKFSDVKFFLSTLENVTALSNDWGYISNMLNSLKNTMSCFETNRFIAVDTQKELEQVATQLFSNATFLIGFVFENTKPGDVDLPEDFRVKIRMNVNNVPETNLPRPWLWIPGPSDNLFMDLRYMRGFVQIQNLLERAIISTINSEKVAKGNTRIKPEAYDNEEFPVVYLQQFPYPKYRSEDVTSSYINYFILPILVTLMWSGNIGMAIRNLIKEKEKFIEETMKAMGLRPGINWLAWFLSTYFNMAIISLLVSLILKYGGIFPLTDLSIIFVALCAFAFSAIMLSFFVASFFSKTNLASLIGMIAYFMSYLPFILVMSIKYELTFIQKIALCLSSATAFGYSSLYISWYELQGKGLQWENFLVSPIQNDQMTFGLAILLMIMDGILYGILGWYVKKVFPSQYGASQPFYFLLTPKFWKNTFIGRFLCHQTQTFNDYFSKDSAYSKNGKKAGKKDKYIESEPVHLRAGISIKDLTRKFKEKVVVNKLSLNFFEGQITALLGHNGAGKSTTINVLTGIYAPSSGTAYIYDKDVRHEYNQIKKNVGICPQHDILFDFMTVKEHLVFYGKLKANMGGKELKRDIADMMTKVGLNQYANEYVSSLSGGLRRRLEVAIAFVSGSKTVILDEPTSGVDPYNRMKIWDIILEFRKSRTILLTTHYLEEADVLSDRIAIIHQGKLQCCGSSLFLKNKFGSGYILTIDKRLHSPSTASIAQSKKEISEARAKSIEHITNFICKRIQDATLTRQINNTLNFTLPYAHKGNFESFFDALEKNKNSLDIASYGISDTTLEEIFLMLTSRDDNGDFVTPITQATKGGSETISMTPNLSASFDSDKDSGVAVELGSLDVTKASSKPSLLKQIFNSSHGLNNSMESMSNAQLHTYFDKPIHYSKLKGRTLYLQQFIALILKRFHHNRRNLRVLATNILLPVIFVALSMGFTSLRPKLTEQASLELTPEIYAPNNYFMTFDQTNNTYLREASENYAENFKQVCQNIVPDTSYSSLSLSKDTLNNYLCNLVEASKCSLIYQFGFENDPSQSSVQNTLQISPATMNCSVEAYLIDTYTSNIDSRYGGITYADDIIKSDMYTDQSKVIVWFENRAYHSMPSFLHQFYNTYTKCADNSDGDKCNVIGDNSRTKPLYRIYNHPIALSDERVSMDTLIQKVSDIGISLTILCAFSFVPAGFVIYIVRERITQEKRLQYVCGVKPFLYWFASFFWDILYFGVIILITLAVIAMFGVTAYTASLRNFTALGLLLLMFGWSSLPMSYVLSRFFKDTGSAYMIVFCITLFSGIATCVSVFLLSFIADSKPDLKTFYNFLEMFSMIFPSYSLGSGLIEITKNQILTDTYAIFGINNVYKDPFAMDMLGKKYISLFLTGVIFFIIVALMECKFTFFSCCEPSLEPNNEKVEDIDVSRERERIENNEANYDVLVAKNLTKRYRKATGSRVCAVNNVCFSIPYGHCFGLLGINGAGKTTTFKMITDELQPTFGTRRFSNMKLKEFLHDNIVGYCPQFDAVDEFLTGKEALFIYSKLIGLNEINAAIMSSIIRFKLQSFINKPIIKYSGGMKRTLSVAVAMLGDPQLVLLDEPTNGMDPEMRRRVWDNILSLIKEDRSVLLTSHSMAECDVLCSRLAIMVNGQFTCLGTTQHLKHRFGGGYTLQIKVSKDAAMNSVCEFVESQFINSIVKDKHGNKIEYIIPHRGNSLGRIFGVMEQNKLNYFIADYSVSQTTLDQVFINFAKSQHGKDSDDEYDEEDEDYDGASETGDDPFDVEKIKTEDDMKHHHHHATEMSEYKIPMPDAQKDHDNSTLESIKNHFNSLKKSRHIRKTSSAKSVNRHQSLRSRKSSQTNSRHRPSVSDGGFTNLAYEVEFRNSAACDLPIQETPSQFNNSFNEFDEYSRC